MPIIDGQEFSPSWPYSQGHYNTIISSLFSPAYQVSYQRSRIELPDDDFIDVDHVYQSADHAVVLCHGLEGSANSSYILHFAHFFKSKGWDVIALNYRGCSGEMNRNLTMYNSGTTGDLQYLIENDLSHYNKIVLIGFSLGGNMVLKYLGEQNTYSDSIRCAVAISTPVNLSNASKELLKWDNFIYQLKFLRSLFSKIRKKKRQFPESITLKPFLKIRNLYDFDEHYTAPLFGYKGAEEYYYENHCGRFLNTINHPSLIINAMDDPFLGDLCYPFDIAENSDVVSLCAPKYGGHCGFAETRKNRTWIEQKVWSFVMQHLS